MHLYGVTFREPYPGHPDTNKVTVITVVTDRETKAIERATREYLTVVEGIALYTMGGTYSPEVTSATPVYDGLVVSVDEGQ